VRWRRPRPCGGRDRALSADCRPGVSPRRGRSRYAPPLRRPRPCRPHPAQQSGAAQWIPRRVNKIVVPGRFLYFRLRSRGSEPGTTAPIFTMSNSKASPSRRVIGDLVRAGFAFIPFPSKKRGCRAERRWCGSPHRGVPMTLARRNTWRGVPRPLGSPRHSHEGYRGGARLSALHRGHVLVDARGGQPVVVPVKGREP
jgi:hypothetical protein